VINGDSICLADLRGFFRFHVKKSAEYSVVLAGGASARDYGVVSIDRSDHIVKFDEKAKTGAGLINAGIYIFNRKIFSLIRKGRKSSLEYDIFPKLIGHKFYGYETKEKLIDIGTPERYKKARRMLGKWPAIN
jgi:NDP-sugar pyrophosphorylase family protein